jgi:predicted N-formylglutamate amidohydrolase
MAIPFMEKLGDRWDLRIGDNLPYSARDHYTYMVDDHAAGVGLPHLRMEIRHDLIETPEGAELWSRRSGGVLARILADPHHYRIEPFP